MEYISQCMLCCTSGVLYLDRSDLPIYMLDVCMYVRVCVCKEDHARFNTSDIFYPTFPFKNRKKGDCKSS